MLSNVTRLLVVGALVALNTFTATPAGAATTNKAPVISGTPATSVTAGSYYAFVPKATDANGDRLTFKISNKPLWARFYTSNGRLSGTPSSAQVGTTANIVISVSDGKVTRSMPAFSISVRAASQAVNHAPTITGTPVTSGTVGQPYAFRPTAADADGNALTFSIANKPSWATFETSTGTLHGTPTVASSTSNVTISVSDGKTKSSLAPFSISILPAAMGQVNLHWTPPTQNTDGTPIASLSGYRISYGNVSGRYDVELNVSGASVSNVVIERLEPGTYYFAVKAVAANGVVSDFSNEVSKVL